MDLLLKIQPNMRNGRQGGPLNLLKYDHRDFHLNKNNNEKIDLSVVITCFNESQFIIDTIETTLEALNQLSVSYEVVIIDDKSQDNSANVIQNYLDSHPDSHLRFKINKVNRGLANNFVDATFYCSGTYYWLRCGDNTVDKTTITSLLRHLGAADIIIPYVQHPKQTGRKKTRLLLSSLFTSTVSIVSGYKLKYFNGLPIFKRYDVMRWPPISYGFGFQADLITRLLDEGCSYIQVPFTNMTERKRDTSTAVSLRHFLSVIHTLVEIIFRRIRKFLFGKEIPKPTEVFPDSK